MKILKPRGASNGKISKCNADVLRAFQTFTDWRIDDLRKQHHVTEQGLPDPDDLWIDESDATTRKIEDLIQGVYCHSSIALCLKEHTEDYEPLSLVEQGLLRMRRIARYAGDVRDIKEWPRTTVYLDKQGPFIEVDHNWDYLDDEDGEVHNAVAEGWYTLSKQYRVEIDEVKARLAQAYFYDPPEPAPRWKPLTRRAGAPVSTHCTAGTDDATLEDASLLTSAAQGGSKKAGEQRPSAEQHITSHSLSSIINSGDSTDISARPQRSQPDLDAAAQYRHAAMLPETIIGLSSAVLNVPDIEDCDEDEYEREWARPAKRLINILAALSPLEAWRHIDRHLRGMLDPSSKSWWSTKRKKKTPITLKHVVNNWSVVEGELDRERWWPDQTTPYDGPQVEALDYVAGYATVEELRTDEVQAVPALSLVKAVPNEVVDEIVDAKPSVESAVLQVVPQVIEEVAPPAVAQSWGPRKRGMALDQAQWLGQQARRSYPELTPTTLEVSEGLHALSLQCGPDENDWLDIYSPEDWFNPPPAIERRIALAVKYGREQARAGPSDALIHEGQQEA